MKDFDKYKIKRQIGIGGTASVYLAEHTGLNRDIVLKVMSDGLFSQDIDYKRLFIEEAQIIAKLNHPNIVQVYDISSTKKRTYIEMEYLSGGNLKERVNKNLYFDPIRVIREIASALQYVFESTGTIHRDIKPSNILFREDDNELVAVLSDFGISKTEDNETEFTSIGVRVGTPRYMSPEQLMGSEVDHRSDLYSLGIILYELVSGEVYERDKSPDVVENFKIPKLPSEHKKLQPIINRLTATNPNDRYKSAEELIVSLRRFDGYLSKSSKKGLSSYTKGNALVSENDKSSSFIKLFGKPSFLIYGLIFCVNVAGAAYMFVNNTDKEQVYSSNMEDLEVMLMGFDQNETDSQNINELIGELKQKYPNDKNILIYDEKVKKIKQKHRKRFLLNSTNKLVENKEYDLAESQLSMVMKLSPTEIEVDEANLISSLITKRKKEVADLIQLEEEKLRIEAELKKVNEETKSEIVENDPPESKKVGEEQKKAVKEKEVVKNNTAKKASSRTDNCHYHLNATLDRHCHNSPDSKHTHNNTLIKKVARKSNPWEHFHPKRPGCTGSVKHTHKFKNRIHSHKYQCEKIVPKKPPKPDPFRHRHPAKKGCTKSVVHSHKFTNLQHTHKYKCSNDSDFNWENDR